MSNSTTRSIGHSLTVLHQNDPTKKLSEKLKRKTPSSSPPLDPSLHKPKVSHQIAGNFISSALFYDADIYESNVHVYSNKRAKVCDESNVVSTKEKVNHDNSKPDTKTDKIETGTAITSNREKEKISDETERQEYKTLQKRLLQLQNSSDMTKQKEFLYRRQAHIWSYYQFSLKHLSTVNDLRNAPLDIVLPPFSSFET